MQTEIQLSCSEEELRAAKAQAQNGNPVPLRALCRKEVDRFEAELRKHPDYSDGLVKIERFAVEGYLYQKLRGHLDAKSTTDNFPEEG